MIERAKRRIGANGSQCSHGRDRTPVRPSASERTSLSRLTALLIERRSSRRCSDALPVPGAQFRDFRRQGGGIRPTPGASSNDAACCLRSGASSRRAGMRQSAVSMSSARQARCWLIDGRAAGWAASRRLRSATRRSASGRRRVSGANRCRPGTTGQRAMAVGCAAPGGSPHGYPVGRSWSTDCGRGHRETRAGD